MTRRETVRNETSQAERRATLRNDQHVHKNCYHSHTHSDEGGRYDGPDQPPRHVVGSTPAPRYPAGPNWSADLTGVEPPLGVPINEIPPVGEAFEVERSLREATSDTVPPTVSKWTSLNGDAVAPVGVSGQPSRQASPPAKSRRGR